METVNRILKSGVNKKEPLSPSFFKTIAGQKLAFYESSGKEDNLLLLHGHPVWSSYFKHQLEGDLGRQYHVVSFDFPGCGNSEPANDPEKTYSLHGLSFIVSEVLRFLGSPFWIAGHSMGANAALHAASQDCKFIKGLFLSGLALTNSGPAPAEVSSHVVNPDIALVLKKDLSDDEISRIADAALIKPEKGMHGILTDGLKRTDPQLRLNMLKDLNSPSHTAQHLTFLNSSLIPIALVEGGEDFLTNISFKKRLDFPLYWKNQLLMVENADHYLHFENPEAVNLMLVKFISEFKRK